MEISKCLVTKLFCIIASIMCVSKANASELINTENMGTSTVLNLDNSLSSEKGVDVAWRFCCGIGSSSDEGAPSTVSSSSMNGTPSNVS